LSNLFYSIADSKPKVCRLLDTKDLRTRCGAQREAVTGSRRYLRNEGFLKLNSASDIKVRSRTSMSLIMANAVV
jgi:hypothetical protein